MTNLQAVFFDIDGTLVSFNTHTIPQSTIEAINQLKNKGVKVIISTGRAYCDINNLGDLKFDGFITANGAYCITTDDEVIFKNLIPKNNLEALVRYQEKKPFPCLFMTDKGNYANFSNADVELIYKMVNLPVPENRPIENILIDDVFQIDAFVDKEGEIELVEKALSECEGARWHPSFADMNVKGNNKGTGVDQFVKYFGVELANTMAFGDGGNDLAMLEHVGVGIAMGNANKEVKEIADYITDSVDDDGIMNALKHYNVL